MQSLGYFVQLLPARTSEQGNVIGLVSVYIYIYICHQKKIVIERTRDLIYLKFVATDFSPKIISPSAGLVKVFMSLIKNLASALYTLEEINK